jgi:hypothetical protein
MLMIPKYIKTLTVTDEIDRLIMDDGYTSFEKLPDDAQNRLAAYSMDALGRDAYECIIEAEDFDGVLAELRQYLLNDNTENAIDLADHLRNNTREYFKRTLALLFEDRYSELECERKREAGLHPIVDHVNGETRWIR